MEPHHKEERLKWAKYYIKKPPEFWHRVVFTDESRVQFNPNKQKFWVHKEERPDSIETDKWQTSILIWGAVTINGTLIIKTVEWTMNSFVYLNI